MLSRLIVRFYSRGKTRKKIVNNLDKKVERHTPRGFQMLWNHDAGFKTIFFWAPLCKWSIVIAGIADVITREDEEISLAQSVSLMMTGAIWSRYSLVIYPVNYMLLSVNMFMFLTQFVMLSRAIKYQYYIASEERRDNEEENNKREESKTKK